MNYLLVGFCSPFILAGFIFGLAYRFFNVGWGFADDLIISVNGALQRRKSGGI